MVCTSSLFIIIRRPVEGGLLWYNVSLTKILFLASRQKSILDVMLSNYTCLESNNYFQFVDHKIWGWRSWVNQLFHLIACDVYPQIMNKGFQKFQYIMCWCICWKSDMRLHYHFLKEDFNKLWTNAVPLSKLFHNYEIIIMLHGN